MKLDKINTLILIAALILLLKFLPAPTAPSPPDTSLALTAVPSNPELRLPIPREEILNRLIETGVIDPVKVDTSKLTDLHLLWAFGLANKNPILETGPMMDPRYGGAERFASTGGWTLTKGNVMDHYSAHQFVTLTAEQQVLVEKLAKNIYRPCCGNSTYFPDCNHGMAMLGLLELLAAKSVSENEMWQTALTANRLWFPDAYAAIDEYLKTIGREASAPEILGPQYSSASGYQRVLSQITPPAGGSGMSCGV
ncbi:MAG: hypothetical protein HYT30_00465 [Parcubacteria group bacterium]|nr:hypothetical protein [Parcubacteria group bacterium]